MSQRVEQKASYTNLKSIERQLLEYAKLSNLEIVQDSVEAKANSHEVKRLTSDFALHQVEFDDLKTRFFNTVDSQHKLADNTKEFSSQIEHRFKIVDDEIARNLIDTNKKVN